MNDIQIEKINNEFYAFASAANDCGIECNDKVKEFEDTKEFIPKLQVFCGLRDRVKLALIENPDLIFEYINP